MNSVEEAMGRAGVPFSTAREGMGCKGYLSWHLRRPLWLNSPGNFQDFQATLRVFGPKPARSLPTVRLSVSFPRSQALKLVEYPIRRQLRDPTMGATNAAPRRHDIGALR